jgi:hypothetical protein
MKNEAVLGCHNVPQLHGAILTALSSDPRGRTAVNDIPWHKYEKAYGHFSGALCGRAFVSHWELCERGCTTLTASNARSSGSIFVRAAAPCEIESHGALPLALIPWRIVTHPPPRLIFYKRPTGLPRLAFPLDHLKGVKGVHPCASLSLPLLQSRIHLSRLFRRVCLVLMFLPSLLALLGLLVPSVFAQQAGSFVVAGDTVVSAMMVCH